MNFVKIRAILIVALCLVQSSSNSQPTTKGTGLPWNEELARLNSILKTLPSDFDKTTFLRTYCGELIDIGRLDPKTSELYQLLNFDSFRLDEFYPLFRNDRLPATCGITSYFYIKLLETFGFKAYQYSFGFREKPYEQFIHSVALVEINFKGSKRLIIQDPYLNLTYRNRDGDPVDFFELLRTIKQRKYDRIVMDSSSLTTFLLVPDPSLYYLYLSDHCKELMSQAIRERNGTFKTKLSITRNYETLMRSPCGNFEQGFVDALDKHGYQEPFLYAYTLRASEMVGDPDHEDVQRQVDAILR